MKRSLIIALGVIALFGFTPRLRAGGSGLNVVIVVNQNSSNSVQLGNYYREARQVPPQNVLRINWTGGNIAWSPADFTGALVNPFLAMLASRQLTNQIDYVVLSMDIPYRVTLAGSGENSTTAALSYGFKPDPQPQCSLAGGSTSAYAGSEGIFRATPPLSASSNSFLVTMITANTLAQAKQIVDQGVLSDATFPMQTVLLGKSYDVIRNIRFFAFDNTVFNTRLRGNYSVLRTNINEPGPITNMLGYANGTPFFNVLPHAFVPGAMADNLTSFGGQLFENPGQTTSLAFLSAGAAGSYGTVTEPCNYPQKFPDPQNYFYQARGFTLAECYYQSLTNPYQGLIVGEPLAAPFAKPGSGAWIGLPTNALLTGVTNLSVNFDSADSGRPLQQIDLFVDGVWFQSLTNIAPTAGDSLNVTVNQQLVNYPVPPGATLLSVASGLVAAINGAGATAKVQAFGHGDRIELQSIDGTKTGAQIPISVASANATGTPTTAIDVSRTNFLDSIAWGLKWYEIGTNVLDSSFLQMVVTKTNGSSVTLTVTNIAGNTDLTTFVQQFANALNNSPALQGDDGLILEDLQPGDPGTIYFDLRARGPGYAAAQIQSIVSGSSELGILSSGTNTITDNLSDLQPRNHLYLTAGTAHLALSFALDTTALADGYHELTAVAYEGSHVHTQTRTTQTILVRNTPLLASFTALVGGTNTALEATLLFNVDAGANSISRIELFGTGGSLGVATNVPTALFSVAAINLGLGLHPFYALVTSATGQQYRTETRTFRLIGTELPFALSIGAPPPTLAWSATAGRRYDILRASLASGPFAVIATITPMNSLAQWTDPNPNSTQLFYRARVSP